MKKYLIISAAALVALAACSKVVSSEPEQEITFQVATYATKANEALDDDTVFGSYAWYTNEDGDETAMFENEQVKKSGTEWKTVGGPYFWPKTGSIDFISYSPWMDVKKGEGPSVITLESLKFDDFKVGEVAADGSYTANGIDLMYADKALDQQKNDTKYKETSGVTSGVPTLFHHALANVSFKIQANFLEYTDPETQQKTTWTVTVKSAKLGGIYTQGDLALTSAATATEWTKPTDNVWTGLDAKVDNYELITKEGGEILTSKTASPAQTPTTIGELGFVIPQKLLDDQQTLTLVMDIVTNQPNNVSFTQENVTRTVNLNTGKYKENNEVKPIKAWEMNQKIVYTILVKPTYGSNPNNPDDPTDDIITFDPAVAGWTEISGATIQL